MKGLRITFSYGAGFEREQACYESWLGRNRSAHRAAAAPMPQTPEPS